MIRGFAQLGHEVVVYCVRLGDGNPRCVPARIVEVERPAQQARTAAVDTAAVPVSERLTKEMGWIERAKSLRTRVLADHALRPFDMIYERYSLWSRAGIEVSRRTRVPCVVEMNAPLLVEAESYRELAAKDEAAAIELDVLRNANAIVAVSGAVSAYACANGASPARVHVIPNGVDSEMFNPGHPAIEVPVLGDAPVLGFVGGLKPWHGLQELLGAFHEVSADTDVRLLILGDGPMRGWIEGYLAGTRLAHRAVLPGSVPHGALAGYINRMDVATAPYPALDDFYFSPLKLFEYMSAGRAIVASRIGQIGEIISHGENGLLVSPGDPRELAAGLRRLLRSPILRDMLGRRARADALKYSWLANARRVVSLAKDAGYLIEHHLAGAPS